MSRILLSGLPILYLLIGVITLLNVSTSFKYSKNLYNSSLSAADLPLSTLFINFSISILNF